MPTFYEFFAGGGMARAGLGSGWECLFANDIDEKKAASYAANWGSEHLAVKDVRLLKAKDLPGNADLVWASFPCQDLSLAGDQAGLRGKRSGTFWPFWRIIKDLAKEGRAPSVVALENVCGALTSHDGKDFAAIGRALNGGGYRFGALVVDAVHFLPQSRPRLFIIGFRENLAAPVSLQSDRRDPLWHPDNLLSAYKKLSKKSKDSWIWWNLPTPAKRKSILADLVEHSPQGVVWHSSAETNRLLGMMTQVNLDKVEKAKLAGNRMIGGIYRRTRTDRNGQRTQRAEVRFDGVAGCLRTPTGGSSRQTILVVEGGKARSRLLSPREAVRLMGLPDNYQLSSNYNEAYHLAGDGVAVPVVRFLAEHIVEPLVKIGQKRRRAAA
jgi:DNA (cytosine-5)-methyltransferase 1